MATVAVAPRVPFVISNNNCRFSNSRSVRQCHKCSWVAHPESSSLSFHYSTSFSASSLFVQRRVRKGIRSVGVVTKAMADLGPSTVLVTGAGGRTGLHVTYVNIHQTHEQLANLSALSTHFPTLHFESISDGFPDDRPLPLSLEYFIAFKTLIRPHFRELLKTISLKAESNDALVPPPSCIMADGLAIFAFDVAEELGLPILCYNATCPRFLWSWLCLPKLIEDGQLPFQDDDMTVEITGVPEMEGLLCRQGLPGFSLLKQANHQNFQVFMNEIQIIKRASALILDTVYELDALILSHMALISPKIYTLRPLHALLNSQIGDVSRGLASRGSLWKSDLNCMTWLDSQSSRSVIYVSFGTTVHLTRAKVIEFWYGLVNSGHPFLWVMRSDITSGATQIPAELESGTKERGYIVDWVSQEEVLAHKSVGGFLTPCGWNSTLESIVSGLPMICWPNIADQYINSRAVCQNWKIGLQLNENCDRSNIESMIRTLMGPKREEIQSSMDAVSKLARDSVAKGGSSHNNLEQLIEYIRNLRHHN